MYLDEDDDLAHEFYEECVVSDPVECLNTMVRWTMRRINDNLRPKVRAI